VSTKGKSIVIRGATVVNPDGVFVADVRIANGVIEAVGEKLAGDIVLEAAGCYVSSGFVDLHTHLREPGKEEAETIESGSWWVHCGCSNAKHGPRPRQRGNSQVCS
jgi:dihydroorotase